MYVGPVTYHILSTCNSESDEEERKKKDIGRNPTVDFLTQQVSTDFIATNLIGRWNKTLNGTIS